MPDRFLPRINTLPVCRVIVRLQALAALKLNICKNIVEFQPPLVSVLHPYNAVLVGIEAGQKALFQPVHDFLLVGFRYVFFRKRQHATGVLPAEFQRVHKLNQLLRVAPQQLRPLSLPVFAQQVIHRASATAAPSGVNFVNHWPYLNIFS